MTDWTAGYVADLGYTHGYYPELNPLAVKLAFLRAGLVCPEIGTACELGFGQGMSANLHAAASVVQWHGTDFNPAQAAFAQELAAVSGAGARLHDDAFADFAQRPDLPDFDFIGLHGIWSWISDENRACIVDFVRRKLKVGGVLYVSYNTQPGWAAFTPMRHLLAQHAAVVGADGQGTLKRVEGALAFADRLLASEPAYAKANPLVAERLKFLKTQGRAYLAHEFFNRDWHPMHFNTMAECLAPAKLSFACSAHLLDHVEALNLTPAQQTLLGEFTDPVLRQSIRDFMVNQQFRKDYWVKGARRLSPLAQAESMRQQRLVLLTHRPDVPATVKGALGQAAMNEELYGPVLDLMADHLPRDVHQIERTTGLPFGRLLTALVVLAGAGHLVPAHPAPLVDTLRPTTDRLNAHLIGLSRSGGDIGHLVSPVTGGGVPVGRMSQLFLWARAQGLATPAEWRDAAWGALSGLNHRLMKDHKPLQTPEENLAEAQRLATLFAQTELPLLQALQVA
ncbi:MAG: methyltransferase regulatory domain-containing protein [Burkholderiales bacterium]|nr:methyltransferase regulatory domain-containing protein [Burkholderiales bacterium]